MGRRVLLLLLAVIGFGAGCSAYSSDGVSASVGSPDLVYVRPGVQVVANADYPVYYASDYYWMYDNGWYRSPYLSGGWQYYSSPPYVIRQIDRPVAYYERYRRYSPSRRIHIDRSYRARAGYYRDDRRDYRRYDRRDDRRYDRPDDRRYDRPNDRRYDRPDVRYRARQDSRVIDRRDYQDRSDVRDIRRVRESTPRERVIQRDQRVAPRPQRMRSIDARRAPDVRRAHETHRQRSSPSPREHRRR